MKGGHVEEMGIMKGGEDYYGDGVKTERQRETEVNGSTGRKGAIGRRRE